MHARAILSLLKSHGWLAKQVTSEWRQDIPSKDITGLLVPVNNINTAVIIAQVPAVLCGIPWVTEINQQLSAHLRCAPANITWYHQEGDLIPAGEAFVSLYGNSRLLLACERSMLNFIQTLSATATVSRTVSQWLCNKCIVLDTRKTLPGLRLAQKYAVAIGGCQAHRLGLSDAFLIKENHIQAAGSISQAITTAYHIDKDALLEVEVETLDELEEALSLPIDRVLLDNFSIKEMQAAIDLRNQTAPQVKLEASGVLFEQRTVEEIGQLGLDYISLGALTKHCHAVDLSMRFVD